jgi:hypothetical protein
MNAPPISSVAQESLEYVRSTQTELIARLEAKQEALVDMRFAEKSISPEVFKRKQAKLDAEIAAARRSRAETEGQLTLEQDDLIMALELVDDVATVYAQATSGRGAASTKPSSSASRSERAGTTSTVAPMSRSWEWS